MGFKKMHSKSKPNFITILAYWSLGSVFVTPKSGCRDLAELLIKL